MTLANIGGGKVPDDRELDGLYIQTIFDGGALAERSLFWAFNSKSKSDLEFAVRLGLPEKTKEHLTNVSQTVNTYAVPGVLGAVKTAEARPEWLREVCKALPPQE